MALRTLLRGTGTLGFEKDIEAAGLSIPMLADMPSMLASERLVALGMEQDQIKRLLVAIRAAEDIAAAWDEACAARTPSSRTSTASRLPLR